MKTVITFTRFALGFWLIFILMGQTFKVATTFAANEMEPPLSFFLASTESEDQYTVRKCMVLRIVEDPMNNVSGFLVVVTPLMPAYDLDALKQREIIERERLPHVLVFPRHEGVELWPNTDFSEMVNLYLVTPAFATKLLAGHELSQQDFNRENMRGITISQIHESEEAAKREVANVPKE